MTFTFDPALPTDRDKVRFLVGDVIDVGHKIENETITALLVIQPSLTYCAAMVADSIAGMFASKVNKAIGQTRIDLSDAFEHWRQKAADLREMGSFDGTGVPTLSPMHVGGISHVEREDLRVGDTDRIQPSFALGQDDETGLDSNQLPARSWVP